MKIKDIIIITLTIILIFTFGFLAKYIPLEIATQRIKVLEYKEGHKCEEFSNELVEELRKQGIQAEVKIGESPTTAKDEHIVHAWVGIWIEPQTGKFTINYE